ncbi:MAG: hypothetical protein WCK94_08880, partial [Comamonadaceae bacterium]
VNGMKRDVCVDEFDLQLPAVRIRPAVWHGSLIGDRETVAISYLSNSTSTTRTPRSPPRAYTETYCLSPGSPAFSSSFQSVSSDINGSSRATLLFELKERSS